MLRPKVLPVLLFPLVLACAGSPPESAPAGSPPPAEKDGEAPEKAAGEAPKPDRDPVLAKKMVTEQGAVLLDVRSDAEFAEGHLDGARNIPHDQMESRISEVLEAVGNDKSKPVVVYCRSGNRSGKAQKTLRAAGFTDVVNLGGMSEWPE